MVILKCHISILTVPVSKSHWLINFCVIGTVILCYIFTDKTFYMPTINVGFWMEDIFWYRCYLIYYYDGMHKETEQPEDACMHFLKMLRKMKATNTAKKTIFSFSKCSERWSSQQKCTGIWSFLIYKERQ